MPLTRLHMMPRWRSQPGQSICRTVCGARRTWTRCGTPQSRAGLDRSLLIFHVKQNLHLERLLSAPTQAARTAKLLKEVARICSTEGNRGLLERRFSPFIMQAHPILKGKYLRILLWSASIALLFVGYTSGLSHNPPGFYVDESAIAYNAYLVSRTGAGEFGPHFPLYFQMFTEGFTAYVNPTQVYLLALVFRFLPPSVLVARLFSAFWVFAACLLLGFLAKRISGQFKIGLIVAGTALLTPWFFDIRGLVLEPHIVPFAVTLFLLAVWYAQAGQNWNWRIIAGLVGSLALLTYCYTSGRVLGGLLAVGLLLFAATK